MEKAIDEKKVDTLLDKTKMNKEITAEELSIITKQKKKPCAGCDGICCTKTTKEKDNGHHHEH